uniref:Uncharacterized protein n=1 Tax=Ditylenchus dipsaci TaxID=166011 RepID=A0A915E7Q9_9BILA
MWGSGVMVVPVITPDVDSVRGYLPGPTGSWYSMSNAHQYGSVQPTGFSTFSAPRDTPLPCFIRAGSIIPKQRPDITTTATRMHEFQLLIALTPDSHIAEGELYWDDGESIVKDFNHHNYLHYKYTVKATNETTHTSVLLPKNTGYNVKSESAGRLLLQKSSQGAKNPYGVDFAELDLTYKQIGSALKVSIGKGNRYIPPVPLDETTPIQSAEKLSFEHKYDTLFSFNVARSGANSSSKIWDTSIGGLLFADQYIQIATYLPSDRVYGFGENIHQELQHNFNQYTTWGMLSRDDGPNSKDPTNHNYYGVHPFYLGVEPDGKAHGVFIFNSNAQEVTTGPGPHLIYRTIGGQLDIFFFPGPRPEQVLQQYHQLIGRPTLPAYWYPIDVAYADIDYMDRYKDFSLGKNWASLPQYMKELHQKGMHMILIFDPAVEVDYDSFQRALQMNASFIQWPRIDLVPPKVQSLYPMVKNTSIMLGIVWPDRHAAFPDFLDKSGVTNQWWADEFTTYRQQVPFDGIWIDMNEPANFGTNEDDPFFQFTADHPRIQQLICPVTGNDSHLDVPPYLTASAYKRGESSLCSKTLCMLSKTGGGNLDFYDTRNLYGWSETVATAKAMKQATGKRGAVISRSTFPSSGHYGGHWLGDNTARWEDLRTSIIGSMEFNFFGIPYVGADVCGFLGQSNEELCLRWQQLGAFHSFYRNHNVINQTLQDPAQWKSVAKATREANLFRYQHLPYLYSLHFHASLSVAVWFGQYSLSSPRTVKVIP